MKQHLKVIGAKINMNLGKFANYIKQLILRSEKVNKKMDR